MSKKSFVDFKRIKESVFMVDVLTRYDLMNQLTRSGDALSGPCRFHDGETDHFRVSVSKNCWNCFGSYKAGGNVIDFVAHKEGVVFRRAAELLQEWFVSKADESKTQKKVKEVPKEEEKPKESQENLPLSFELKNLDPAHPYLLERGLTPETIAAFGLGFSGKGSLAGRIAIPIHNPEGNLVAYAGRWPGQPPGETPKYKFPAGFKKSLELFNLHRAIQEPETEPWVVVEGFFDVIQLWQNGLRRVVALMGSALSPIQERLILQHTQAQTRVLVMLDEDDAGRAGREHIVQHLAAHRFVKIHPFPKVGMQPENLTVADLAKLKS